MYMGIQGVPGRGDTVHRAYARPNAKHIHGRMITFGYIVFKLGAVIVDQLDARIFPDLTTSTRERDFEFSRAIDVRSRSEK